MYEKPFGMEPRAPEVEVKQMKIKKLEEGVSTGWENERRFTMEEVVAALQELGIESADLKTTDQIVSHEGVLLSAYMRAPQSASGYLYMLKGSHGPHLGSTKTTIDSVDYADSESEDVVYAEAIAEYRDDTWVKL